MGVSLTNTQLEQIRVCSQIGVECMNEQPDKRPSDIKDIIDRLEKAGRTQVWSKVQTCSWFIYFASA